MIAGLTSATLAIAASGANLPAGRSSLGLKIISGPRGGRILVARERGVSNPIAALRSAVAAGGSYFDGPPSVKSVVETTDGRAAYAAFGAILRGTPVVGVTIVALQPHGGAQVVAFFDRPSHLETSLRPMLASLGTPNIGSSAGGANGRAEPLRPYQSPDGSASVDLPANWTVTSASEGQLMAHDPSNAENAELGVSISITDPHAGMGAQIAASSGGILMPYDPDPGSAYVGLTNVLSRRTNVSPNVKILKQKAFPSNNGRFSFIAGEETSPKGVRDGFLGDVGVTPVMAMGGYLITVTMVSGPLKKSPDSVATLAAIFESYHVNGGVRAAQVNAHQQETIARTQQIIAGIHATGEASMRNAAASQAAIDRSTSGYVHYLNGSDVIENIGSGSRASVDASFAQNVAKSDPQNFRVVPMTEYRAGD